MSTALNRLMLCWSPAASLQRLCRGTSRGLAQAAVEDDAGDGKGLPPSSQPPPHSPVTLRPKAPPTLEETLQAIRQASTPLEVHNAYRRRPSSLPPAIAAAKLQRLAQLLPAGTEAPAPAPAQVEAEAGSSSPSQTPDTRRVVQEVLTTWDALLHLFTAQQLATCVRAACESGIGLDGQQGGASAGSSSGSSRSGGVVEVAGEQLAVQRARTDRGLLRRSLLVLLDRQGAELQAAGPQAVVDVAYGLMRVGHRNAADWAALKPLLLAAQQQQQQQQQGASKAGEELAGVLGWIKQAGLD